MQAISDKPIWHKVCIPKDWSCDEEETLWVSVQGISAAIDLQGSSPEELQLHATGFWAKNSEGQDITLTDYQKDWLFESATIVMEVLRRWADILEAQVTTPLQSIPDGGYTGESLQVDPLPGCVPTMAGWRK